MLDAHGVVVQKLWVAGDETVVGRWQTQETGSSDSDPYFALIVVV